MISGNAIPSFRWGTNRAIESRSSSEAGAVGDGAARQSVSIYDHFIELTIRIKVYENANVRQTSFNMEVHIFIYNLLRFGTRV